MHKEIVDQRRAMEALRAGVPNRDVVRQLKPMQPEIEERFETLLASAEAGWESAKQALGLLLKGDFGTGKSHWLEYFQHIALENNFLCSRIVINKETPLYDLNKVYRACVESASAPGKNVGPALEEIILTYNFDKAPYYRELFEWVNQNRDLDPRIEATLLLLEHSHDSESDLLKQIIAEWTGYPMKVGELKKALKDIGEPVIKIGRPQKGQTLHYFEFLARFFRSAGYAGWVLLFDEAEMISKYSLRQRARAYAHLAQLSGLVKGVSIPGVASVFTVTDDYTGQVLLGRKNDLDNIPARLEGTREESFASPAKVGMKAIESKGIELRPSTRDQVEEVYRKIRVLYSNAYGWDAPDLQDKKEYSSSTGMREYIRSWVNTWDLRRLYDYEAHLVTEDITISYEEDKDMQDEMPEQNEPIITT